jgi:hypothetical protein
LDLGEQSIKYIHPLPAHQHYTIKYIKNYYRKSWPVKRCISTHGF